MMPRLWGGADVGCDRHHKAVQFPLSRKDTDLLRAIYDGVVAFISNLYAAKAKFPGPAPSSTGFCRVEAGERWSSKRRGGNQIRLRGC
jgi:hypothetical protein